jgi:tetratricopeptide (TPR) repeat protein
MRHAERAEEAVRIRRMLAEASPDAYLPDLALCLNSLSTDLGAVGRREEALAAIQEAVKYYRTLAEEHLQRFESALRGSMEVAAWLADLPAVALDG